MTRSSRARLELRGARALVTGASGGIGAAIARELDARGAQLIITGRNQRPLDQLAQDLATPPRIITADLADPAEVTRLLAAAGDVDVLVANAGLEASEPIEQLTAGQLERVITVNLTAPALLIRGVTRGMLQRRRGHAVLVSSIAGRSATAMNGPAYTATKWGLRGLALALAQDWHATGVRVSAIYPGPVSGAGMFASAGLPAPAWLGTSTTAQVARAVADAIEHGRTETIVARPLPRLVAEFGAIAPECMGAISRAKGRYLRDKMLAVRQTRW